MLSLYQLFKSLHYSFKKKKSAHCWLSHHRYLQLWLIPGGFCHGNSVQASEQAGLSTKFVFYLKCAISYMITIAHICKETHSILIMRQVWRMPKLWVGFLKCISQTQPHSFHVLLQVFIHLFFVALFFSFPFSLNYIKSACSCHRLSLKVHWTNIKIFVVHLQLLWTNLLLKPLCLGMWRMLNFPLLFSFKLAKYWTEFCNSFRNGW